MEEIWRRVNIKDYCNNYEVSTSGKIKNINTGEFLKIYQHQNGYKYISICALAKEKRYLMHRLVAITFLPNFYGKPEINHKDKDKGNNNIFNIQWVTRSENMKHASETPNRNIKKIFQYDLQMNFIREFDSVKDAITLLQLKSCANIRAACLGKYKHAYGFIWRYENYPVKNNVDLNNFKQIRDFPSYYVSKKGEIYSLKHNKLLKQQCAGGYKSVCLSHNKIRKTKLVHILVAEEFLTKPTNIKNIVVDHINGIKHDNNVVNLRYVTQSENCIASFYSEDAKNNLHKRTCAKYNLNMELIEIYLSVNDASRDNNLCPTSVHRCCKGEQSRVANHIYKYIES